MRAAMKKIVASQPPIQIEPNLKRRSANGVAVILDAIQPNIIAYCDDDVCAVLIDECVAHLRSRYRVSAPTFSADTEVKTASLAALVRLLLYVRTELIDELGEIRCANLLQACIDHILKNHQHDPAHSNGRSTHPAP